MEKTVKLNSEYSPMDYERMGLAAMAIQKRIERALAYGPDMPSSRHSCLLDVQAILERLGNDNVVRLGVK